MEHKPAINKLLKRHNNKIEIVIWCGGCRFMSVSFSFFLGSSFCIPKNEINKSALQQNGERTNGDDNRSNISDNKQIWNELAQHNEISHTDILLLQPAKTWKWFWARSLCILGTLMSRSARNRNVRRNPCAWRCACAMSFSIAWKRHNFDCTMIFNIPNESSTENYSVNKYVRWFCSFSVSIIFMESLIHCEYLQTHTHPHSHLTRTRITITCSFRKIESQREFRALPRMGPGPHSMKIKFLDDVGGDAHTAKMREWWQWQCRSAAE